MKKKLIIHGLGISGKSAAKLAKSQSLQVTIINNKFSEDDIIFLNDLNLDNFYTEDQILSKSYDENDFKNVDQYILSPGIPRTNKCVSIFLKKGISVISDIEYWHQCLLDQGLRESTPIIAVTGSNGKTTTVKLLEALSRAKYKNVFVGGNIGRPVCDFFLEKQEYDLVLLELSSFQLESIISFRANLSLITNVVFHHGERYKDLSEYQRAKEYIFKNSTSKDIVCTFENFKFIDTPKCSHLIIDKDLRNIENNQIIELIDCFKLIGSHNKENLLLALMSISKWDEEFICNENLDKIKKAISTFKQDPHRFEVIETRNHTFINDAKATNLLATEKALESMLLEYENKKHILILGGQLRGRGEEISYNLKNLISKIDYLYLIGDSRHFLVDQFPLHVKKNELEKLEECIHSIKGKIVENSIILYSPGFPSFDQFNSYIERGNRFKELVGLNFNN